MIIIKSKLKVIALIGLILSVISLFTHFLLARYTGVGQSFDGYQASFTIFSWRPIFQNFDLAPNRPTPTHKRLWGPVRSLESIHPHANPRGHYEAPALKTNGFIFVRIQGGFHHIRNSICDAVVVARLLNATLVIPELQSTTSSKGISSQFKSFAYLYNEDQFIVALAKDVVVVKTLPKDLKSARRKKEIPSFRVPYSSSPDFYLHHVLPVLRRHLVVELVISDGGGLQAILPPHLEEYQRLRCKVAYHALHFREEVQELATTIINRLRASRRPFIAFDPGMTRDALAYHGCAELFQDVHTELIQHRRAWMIKRGIVKGKLTVDSVAQPSNGSCPLMPEEVGILLHAYGYSWDTVIYVSGGEVFGGQRALIPLHAMFENVVDRTFLSTFRELSRIYGRERHLVDSNPRPPSVQEEKKTESWETLGARPRPLPPPPSKPKTHNIEGWWGWVAESDNEPESTVTELRINAHKLLWEAIDYTVCVEADAFIPGFDRDGKGRPNFGSLVTGHRLYHSPESKTFRPDRFTLPVKVNLSTMFHYHPKSSFQTVSQSFLILSAGVKTENSKEVIRLLDEVGDHVYQANSTWLKLIRKHLSKSIGVTEAFRSSKPQSFLAHPVPECSCLKHQHFELSNHTSSPSNHLPLEVDHGVEYRCPAWMDNSAISQSPKFKEYDEDLDEEDSTTSALFFGKKSGNNEVNGEETNNKEVHMEDQDELEGAEK